MGKRIFTCVAKKKEKKIMVMIIIMIINIISHKGIKGLKDPFKKSF